MLLFALLVGCAPTDVKTESLADTGWIDQDGDGFLAEVDCNDEDAGIHPGASDGTADGADQNCDGVDGGSVGTDADGDGYLEQVDCNDADAAIHQGAMDGSADGVDQNCDGTDGSSGGSFVDDDADGYAASVDCNDHDAGIHPGAADPSGDGVDQNCNGVDDPASADADSDGYASVDFSGGDCNDQNAAIHPGATEKARDGVDQDCDGADFAADGLAAGELVITEIMYDPDVVADGDGEWFELYNNTAFTVNLRGLIAADDPAFGAADVFTVGSDVVVTSHDRVVLGVKSDSAVNGGVTVDYDYQGAGVNLNNSADDIYIGVSVGGRITTLDSVSYDELNGWPLAKGLSIELKTASTSATANDKASNWCPATSRINGANSDMGTPGKANGC